MSTFKTATGIILMEDKTNMSFNGIAAFDPRMFLEPNNIVGLVSDDFIIELTNGNTVTFTDAQQLRLFVGHNKMLEEQKEANK